MPSEPENKMDPLLKAYAARRKESADPGRTLPPEARRKLLAEVRERWGRSGTASGETPLRWYQVLGMFWPRLAAAAGIVLVLAFALSAFLPSWRGDTHLASTPKPDSQPEAQPAAGLPMMKQLADEPAPATTAPAVADAAPTRWRETDALETLRPAAQEEMVKAKREEGRSAELGAAQDRKAVPPRIETELLSRVNGTGNEARSKDQGSFGASPLGDTRFYSATPPSPPVNGPAQVSDLTAAAGKALNDPLALTATTAGSRPMVLERSERSQSQLARGAQPTQLYFRNSAPPASAAATTGLADEARSERSEPSRSRRASRSPAPTAATAAPSNQSPVLTTFAFEQDGTTVRLIDADGSIYQGTLTPPAGAQALEKKAEARFLNRDLALAESLTAGPDRQLAFEVSGTNTTLRQPVFVIGTLLLDSTNQPGLLSASEALGDSPSVRTADARSLGSINLQTSSKSAESPASAPPAALTLPTTTGGLAGNMKLSVGQKAAVSSDPGLPSQTPVPAEDFSRNNVGRTGVGVDKFNAPAPVAPAPVMQSSSPALPGAPGQTIPKVIRIQGRGRYGTSNDIRLDAVPTTPR
jgi:hypothetical protein